MTFPPVPRSVLLTGCSSGIGLASARMLKARGWRVFATARKPDDVLRLRHEGFEALILDVADTDSVRAAAAEVERLTQGRLGALVNNAGYGQPGAMEDISRETLRAQYEVNVFGLHDLTRACLPMFRRQRAGRIVNISSVLGRISVPILGAYASSKFAVEAISDALRVEVRAAGIAVALIEPGPIVTDFRKNSVASARRNIDLDHSLFKTPLNAELERREHSQKPVNRINRPPADVGRKVIHALESARPHRRYCVTIPAYFGAFVRRFFPDALTDAILAARTPRAD